MLSLHTSARPLGPSRAAMVVTPEGRLASCHLEELDELLVNEARRAAAVPTVLFHDSGGAPALQLAQAPHHTARAVLLASVAVAAAAAAAAAGGLSGVATSTPQFASRLRPVQDSGARCPSGAKRPRGCAGRRGRRRGVVEWKARRLKTIAGGAVDTASGGGKGGAGCEPRPCCNGPTRGGCPRLPA